MLSAGAFDSRDAEVLELRQRGLSLQEIASSFGISRERVRQIVRDRGGPNVLDLRRLKDAADKRQDEARTQQIREHIQKVGPMLVADVAESLGIAKSQVSRLWPSDLAGFKVGVASTAWISQTWSDDQILRALSDAATYEFPLTSSAYRDLVRSGQVNGPSLPRVTQRFGSWAAACSAAGVEHGKSLREYQSRWSDEDLLGYAADYFLDGTASNSARKYDEWRKSNSPEAPSGMTLRNRFGTWTEIKRRALARSWAESND